MTKINQQRVLVIDTEATCWDGPLPPDEHPEIIQIALVEIYVPDLTISRCQDHIIRPTRSKISQYCANLTGISPDNLRGSHHLDQVLRSLAKSMGTSTKPLIGWGRDDQFIQHQCQLRNINYPFSKEYINFGQVFNLFTGNKTRTNLQEALKQFGLEFIGKPHNALNDAINTAKLWIEFSRRFR